jgi:dTDP-4-dehydrorhamnose reductase
MTKIIGTGLSGLVGSRIVELLQRKHDFIDFSLDSGVDITDREVLEKNIAENKDAEVILHLAAFTDVNAAWEQQGDEDGVCYQVNVVGTRNVAELAAEYDKYLVHISTDFVFDGKRKTFYTEKDQPNPIEWYGKTKYLAEREVEKAAGKSVIARIAFPYKAEKSSEDLEPKPKIDLVRKIINTLEKGEEFHGFHDQIITPTFIDDIAKAVEIFFKQRPTGLYHVVGSTALSPYELALRIAEIFVLPKENVKEASLSDYLKEDKRPRQRYLAVSNRKLEEDLGVSPLRLRPALEKVRSQRK